MRGEGGGDRWPEVQRTFGDRDGAPLLADPLGADPVAGDDVQRPVAGAGADAPQAAQRFEITISESVSERALGRADIAPTQPVLAVVRDRDATGARSWPGSGWRPRGPSCAAARR